MVDAVADRVEVLDDVVDRQHPQPEPLFLEPGRNLEVVRDELLHAAQPSCREATQLPKQWKPGARFSSTRAWPRSGPARQLPRRRPPLRTRSDGSGRGEVTSASRRS